VTCAAGYTGSPTSYTCTLVGTTSTWVPLGTVNQCAQLLCVAACTRDQNLSGPRSLPLLCFRRSCGSHACAQGKVPVAGANTLQCTADTCEAVCCLTPGACPVLANETGYERCGEGVIGDACTETCAAGYTGGGTLYKCQLVGATPQWVAAAARTSCVADVKTRCAGCATLRS
jgi:hypothetical protein